MIKNTLFVLSALMMGCMKPYKKVHPTYDASKGYNGVLINATINGTGLLKNGEEAKLTNARDAIEINQMNKSMDALGGTLFPSASAYWKTEGFTVESGKDRVNKEGSAAASIMNMAANVWVHPESASNTFVNHNTILLKAQRQKMIEPFNTEVENEAFVITAVHFKREKKFLIMHRPTVVFDTIIIGEGGEYLYRSRGVGAGDQRAMLMDMSEENVKKGFDSAIESLGTAETKIVDK